MFTRIPQSQSSVLHTALLSTHSYSDSLQQGEQSQENLNSQSVADVKAQLRAERERAERLGHHFGQIPVMGSGQPQGQTDSLGNDLPLDDIGPHDWQGLDTVFKRLYPDAPPPMSPEGKLIRETEPNLILGEGASNIVEGRQLQELSNDFRVILFLKLNVNDPSTSMEMHQRLHELMTRLSQLNLDAAENQSNQAEELSRMAEGYAQMVKLLSLLITLITMLMSIITALLASSTEETEEEVA